MLFEVCYFLFSRKGDRIVAGPYFAQVEAADRVKAITKFFAGKAVDDVHWQYVEVVEPDELEAVDAVLVGQPLEEASTCS